MKKENLSKEDILNRIGYYLNEKNISGRSMGEQLGHAKNYYYRIQNKEIILTVDLLLDILDVLKITTSEFFTPLIDEQSLKLLEKINSLSPDKRKTIENLINQFN